LNVDTAPDADDTNGRDLKDKSADIKIAVRKDDIHGKPVLLIRWSTPTLAVACSAFAAVSTSDHTSNHRTVSSQVVVCPETRGPHVVKKRRFAEGVVAQIHSSRLGLSWSLPRVEAQDSTTCAPWPMPGSEFAIVLTATLSATPGMGCPIPLRRLTCDLCYI